MTTATKSMHGSLPQPGIELYSGKYFAACGLGGILGVSAPAVSLGDGLC